MSLGAVKQSLLGAAGAGGGNYFGDGSLGDCQFGASGITQSGDTVAIDTVLTTGSEAGGPGSSSYGDGVPNDSACYETTVLSKSGSYDGDMWVGNFKDLTIDASVTFTTDQPCRGMLLYVDGDCVINGALSMIARGGLSDPTSSGGSDSSAVSATGIRLPLLTASGTDTLAAADFAGCGNAAVAAVANQGAVSGNGTIFTISKTGATGGASRAVTADGSVHEFVGNAGSSGTTGGVTLSTGGGGTGGFWMQGVYSVSLTISAGGTGGAFSGGAGSAGAGNYSMGGAQTVAAGGDYGGAGSNGIGHTYNNFYGASGGGAGNPGGTKTQHSGGSNTGYDGGDGSGGLIWLIVKGNLTIGSGGKLTCDGVAGGAATGPGASQGGGGTGGGALMALYGGALSNSGSITSALGAGGAGANKVGGNGGAGGVYTAQIDN